MTSRIGECLLREIRTNAGLTQDELSDKLYKRFGLEVSSGMIGHYENNRKPINIVVLRAFAIIFNKHMDDFYRWNIK